MGYLHLHKQVPPQQLSLSWYRHSMYLAGFLTFLAARDVGKGHLLRHCSLAIKVNVWLQRQPCSGWQHHDNMLSWLAALRAQLPVLGRAPQQKDLPPAEEVYAWVDQLVEDAKVMCLEDW